MSAIGADAGRGHAISRREALITSLGALAWAHPAAAAADGLAAMTLSYNANRFASSRFKAELKLEGSGPVRVRALSGATKLVDGGASAARLLRFSAPADMSGVSTLTVERAGRLDDLWIYLPSLKKVRRLVSSNKRDPWVGSEFTLGDIVGYKLDDWTHTLAGEVTLEGQACTIIESKPAAPAVGADTGLSRRLTYARKADGVALKSEMFDPAGGLARTMTASAVTALDAAAGKHQPMRILMKNARSGASSTLAFSDFVYKAAVADGDVTPEALEG